MTGSLAVLERAFRELCRGDPRPPVAGHLRPDRSDPDRRRAWPRTARRVARAAEHDIAGGQQRAGRDPPAAAGRPDADGGQRRAGLSSPPSRRAGGSPSPTSPPPENPREQLRHARGAGARADALGGAPRRRRSGACTLTGQIQAALAGAGIETYLLDGVAGARAAVGAPASRRERAARPRPARRRGQRRRQPPRRRGQRAAPSACCGRCVTARWRDRRRREPGLSAPCRSDAGGGPASRHSAACRPVRGGWRTCWRARCRRRWRCTSRSGVARREQGRQRRRWKRLRAADPLQGAPRAARRLRRARGAR